MPATATVCYRSGDGEVGISGQLLRGTRGGGPLEGSSLGLHSCDGAGVRPTWPSLDPWVPAVSH